MYLTTFRVIWAKVGAEPTIFVKFMDTTSMCAFNSLSLFQDQFVSNKTKSKEPLLKLSRVVDGKEVWAYVFEFLSAESPEKAWADRDKATEYITKFLANFKTAQPPPVVAMKVKTRFSLQFRTY